MRISLILLLSLALPALAYDGEEYPEAYDNQGEVYQDESYPNETYPQETYPEETYQEQTYPEQTYPEETYPADTYQEEPYQEETYQPSAPMEEPVYQEPADASHMQEIRAMCQQYAAEMPPEEQGAYIEDCLHSQGY